MLFFGLLDNVVIFWFKESDVIWRGGQFKIYLTFCLLK